MKISANEIKVGNILEFENKLPGFLSNSSSGFNLGALVAARVTRECHNDDLLEEGDRRNAHLGEAVGVAGAALSRKPHH